MFLVYIAYVEPWDCSLAAGVGSSPLNRAVCSFYNVLLHRYFENNVHKDNVNVCNRSRVHDFYPIPFIMWWRSSNPQRLSPELCSAVR